jgi:hypothetical protein
MKRVFLPWAVAIVLAFILGYRIPHARKPPEVLDQKTGQSPFSISVVPAWSGPSGRGISMATNTLDTFYVILTNVSKEAQPVFRTSNSWGYYAVSFELQTVDGHVVAITKRPQGFTKNNPTTFVVPPDEHMVYAIRLDDEWDAVPPPPIADETPIAVTIKATYEVKPTPESAQQNVWTGRLESPSYKFRFRHW